MSEHPTGRYKQIRNVLQPVIGQRLVDITQPDPEEYHETGVWYIALHFENGQTLRFANGPGAVAVTTIPALLGTDNP